MPRERRMISCSISTSKKVALLTDQEALIFTWLIPWTDDECRMEADPEIIKARIFPLRQDITPEVILYALNRFHEIGLGCFYNTREGVVVNHFFEFSNKTIQTFHSIKKIPSILPSYKSLHQERCSTTPERVPKLNEVKLNEVKLNEANTGKGVVRNIPIFLQEKITPEIKEIFDYAQNLPIKPSALNLRKIENIQDRLNTFTVDQIKSAIDNISQDQFSIEKRIASLEYLCKSDENIEKWSQTPENTEEFKYKTRADIKFSPEEEARMAALQKKLSDEARKV